MFLCEYELAQMNVNECEQVRVHMSRVPVYVSKGTRALVSVNELE